MKKKIISLVIIAVMVLAMAACGVNVSSTSTTTETHTDANGNTTTTTTTTTTENGKTETTTNVEESSANQQIVADMTFQNDTGFDIAELYFTNVDDDNWGVNILEASEYGTLSDMSGVTLEKKFKYTMDDVIWDMKIVDEDGNYVEFAAIDLSGAADPENITLIMEYDAAEDGYTVTVE